MKTDTIAKKFLTELNGFDFLLDRLFAKAEEQKRPEVKPVMAAKKEEIASHPKVDLTLDDLFGDEAPPLDLEAGESEDQYLFDLALKKLSQQKEASGKAFGPATKTVPKKPSPEELKKKEEDAKLEEEAKTDPQGAMIKEIESKVVIDDWGKNLKLVWTSDRKELAKGQYQSTQWHKFKNGTKNRLYNYVISDKDFNYEYVMKFDMESVVMLNEVQIGIVYNWSTYDPDCNVEPLTILAEGGKDQDSVEWRAILHPVKDDGF